MIIQSETLKDRKQKLAYVLNNLATELSVNEEKVNRAEKSLGLIKTNLQKKKVEIPENSPHIAQLEFDIQTDRYKTLVSCLHNLGNELPELGPMIEDVLKEYNI